MTEFQKMRGAVILAGGRSRRMGRPKGLLQLGRKTYLEHVVDAVHRAVGPIVLVTSPEQELPQLPATVERIADRQWYPGPLPALAQGLQALQGIVPRAFLTGCDVPLLRSEFVSRLFELAGDADVAMVVEGDRLHPLAAVYRTDIAPAVEQLVRRGEQRLQDLSRHFPSVAIPASELSIADPQLVSLLNANTPADRQRIEGLWNRFGHNGGNRLID